MLTASTLPFTSKRDLRAEIASRTLAERRHALLLRIALLRREIQDGITDDHVSGVDTSASRLPLHTRLAEAEDVLAILTAACGIPADSAQDAAPGERADEGHQLTLADAGVPISEPDAVTRRIVRPARVEAALAACAARGLPLTTGDRL